MDYRPPKGVAPPQLAGKRTGRPRGTRNHAKLWADVLWGFRNRHLDRANPPTKAAWLWWTFAANYPDEVEEFLEEFGRI